MMRLTNRNPQRQLAIVFDGYVISAPTIVSPFGRQCQLTGKFTREEIVAMILPLRQAKMFAVLEPIPVSEVKVAAESEK